MSAPAAGGTVRERAEPEPFRVTGELPGAGLTVIEASAGTGKTYTLTSLVVRYVAEGTPLDSILAVTFTRMATGELRDRIRERMVAVHRGLSSAPDRSGDDLVRLLGEGGEDQVRARERHLADALADFDAATIATTHGFCQMVLHGLGSAGDTAPDAVLLEDPSDLVAEVVDDLYLRWSFTRHGAPPFTPAVARRAALRAIGNPETAIFSYPGGDPPSPASVLGRLAAAARAEVARRLLQDDALTYDELLSRLAGTLRDEERGPEACRRLADRYRVVLVDEFQDTDPVQWTILRQAFGRPDAGTRLVLIGDPKQAIYAFRGADVHAYLDAADSARLRYTLADNWRTDQALLDATAALFTPLQFGHEGIPFRSVQAPPGRPSATLPGPPMRVRVIDDDQAGVQKTVAKGFLQKNALVDWVAADVAADISRLLSSVPGLPDGRGGTRTLEAADVAVLTRTNPQAVSVRDALRAAGVPAVVAGSDSVFRSEACRAWVHLLEAIQEPTSRSRLVALALSPFIGMRAEEVAEAGEDIWEDLYDRVHSWAGVLATRGVAALHRAITAEEGVPGRVLAEEGGERVLTDLGHVAQLLHAEASAGQLGASSLRSWLVARIRAVDEEQAEAEERSRRLDSDAAAVQVLTVHRAKGLEFPVVYCPYLWDGGQSEGGGSPVVFHDPDAGGARTLDCGALEKRGEARNLYDAHARIAEAEQRGEDLRLMYVAVTRARHQVVLWWGRSWRSGCSPLGRLLLCRHATSGEVGPARQTEPKADLILPALQEIEARAGGLIAVEPAVAAPGPTHSPGSGAEAPPALDVARFDRSLDLRWRRASYTSITAAAHGEGESRGVASEPEEPGVSDEPVVAGVEGGPVAGGGPVAEGGRAAERGPAAVGPAGLSSLWASLPGGAEVGTFVHRVLEATDFAATDLRAALSTAVAGTLGVSTPPLPPDTLVDALQATLTTPLDPLLTGETLSGIARSDRLDELGFELPVAGGDRPTGFVRTADIADLLDRYLGAAGRLGGYAERLRDPSLDGSLRGYLTGSLDLVFRRLGPGGVPRWYVADYKTNWLGAPGATLSPTDYAPAALDAEMRHRHYPLQALLYSVALHRYLRWRQPGYRPDTHLGGVLYLFVRGMAGPSTPALDGSTCGVWSWPVPPDLVVALSDLMDVGSEATG